MALRLRDSSRHFRRPWEKKKKQLWEFRNLQNVHHYEYCVFLEVLPIWCGSLMALLHGTPMSTFTLPAV